MSKFCPTLKRKVIYLDCLECEEKLCEESQKQNESKNIFQEYDKKEQP